MTSQGSTPQSLARKAGEATVGARLVLETIGVLVSALEGQQTVREGANWQVAGRPEDHVVVIYIQNIQLRLKVRRMLREGGISTRIHKETFLRIDLPVDKPEVPGLRLV